MKTLGQKLKEARELAGMSQSQVAEKLGTVTRSAISLYESDKREPDRLTLRELAFMYELDINYLLDDNATESVSAAAAKRSMEIAMSHDEDLFSALLTSAGYKISVDGDGNMFAYRGKRVVNITPDVLAHLLTRVNEYFELLMLGASEK